MICERCRKKMKRGWKFCPSCGTKIRILFNPFNSMFNRFFEEVDEIEDFPMDFEAFDMSPLFGKKPRSKGFMISIKQSSTGRPRIDIKPFGDVNGQEKREKEKPIIKPRFETRTMPKTTEEPKTRVKRLNNKLLVEMELPGVKSEKDVDLNELSESIEIRAFGKNKAYFKILKKPERFRIARKEMDGDKLKLEFSV